MVGSLERGPVDVRVGHEETVDIPERQEPPLDVPGRLEAEADRLGDGLGREHVADHVGAHLLERVVEPDRVPPALVHLAPVAGEHPLVRQHRPIGARALHGGRHEEQGVEPSAELAHGLDDEVGREPALPLPAILEVAQGREGHDAGVEPAVADLGDAPDGPRAGGAPDEDGVEPRAMQLGHRVDGAGIQRQLPKLPARTDHREAPALARVERQRKAPVPLARDAPVAHVGEPVVHAPLHVAREPGDTLVGGPGQRSDLGGAEEPLVRNPEDQLVAAPPAGGIAMPVRGPREEQAALLQQAGDGGGGVGHPAPREGPEAIEVASLPDPRAR